MVQKSGKLKLKTLVFTLNLSFLNHGITSLNFNTHLAICSSFPFNRFPNFVLCYFITNSNHVAMYIISSDAFFSSIFEAGRRGEREREKMMKVKKVRFTRFSPIFLV